MASKKTTKAMVRSSSVNSASKKSAVKKARTAMARSSNRPANQTPLAGGLWKTLAMTIVRWLALKLEAGDGSRTESVPKPRRRKQLKLALALAGIPTGLWWVHHLWKPCVLIGVHWLSLKLRMPGYIDIVLLIWALRR